MADDMPVSPLRIQLTEDRRRRMVDAIKRHFEGNFDEPLSDFRATALLDFLVGELGPAVYDQAVHDACASMQGNIMNANRCT